MFKRGVYNSYGAFQTFYEQELLNSNSASSIAWIGSIQGFLLMFLGALIGPFFDKGYFRSLLLAGTLAVVFGLMMTSISTKYYQVFLSQGVVVGLGSSFLFVPSVAILATYFNRKRSLAVGVALTGSSLGTLHYTADITFILTSWHLGGVIYPAVFRELQSKIGFGWTTRVMAFIALGTLSISLVVMRHRGVSHERRRFLDLDAWKEAPYTLFVSGLTIAFMSAYIPFFYISAYASAHTSASDELAFYFVAILNAASTFGRLLPNFLADKTGPLNMFLPCTIVSGILALCWIATHNTGGLLAFAILYGFFSGTIVSLPPSIIASLTSDLARVGTRMGMCFSIVGIGLLVGNPIAGALINLDTGDFLRAQIFCGVLVISSAVIALLSRTAKVGWSLMVKV
jgi:MFS family permease